MHPSNIAVDTKSKSKQETVDRTDHVAANRKEFNGTCDNIVHDINAGWNKCVTDAIRRRTQAPLPAKQNVKIHPLLTILKRSYPRQSNLQWTRRTLHPRRILFPKLLPSSDLHKSNRLTQTTMYHPIQYPVSPIPHQSQPLPKPKCSLLTNNKMKYSPTYPKTASPSSRENTGNDHGSTFPRSQFSKSKNVHLPTPLYRRQITHRTCPRYQSLSQKPNRTANGTRGTGIRINRHPYLFLHDGVSGTTPRGQYGILP